MSVAETWRKGLHGSANRIPESVNFWLWFSQSSARFLISDVLAPLSRLGFLFFLVALARQVQLPRDPGEGRTPLIRNVALLAAIIGVLGLILIVTSQYGTMQYRGRIAGVPNGLTIVRTVIFGLPGLIAPMIVYSSVRPVAPLT